LTIIDVPGGAYPFPTGINDEGYIVGFYMSGASSPPRPVFSGFLRSPTGAISSIHVPGAESTQTWGINARGDITGEYYSVFGPFYGFVLAKDVLRPINAVNAIPTGINARREVVGFTLEFQNAYGFLRHPDHGFTDIQVPGGTQTQPWAINAHGDVVGSYEADGLVHGFLAVDRVDPR
jgi:hypothetical protein